MDIPTGSYKTQGMTEIISIDGEHGVQINLLESNKGMIQIGAIPIPFAYLIAAAIIFFIVGTIGVTGKKAGGKYIWRGIKFIIPIILIIIAIMLLPNLTYHIEELEGASDAEKILENIASSPFGGKDTLTLPDYGDVNVKWGFEIGAFLLLLAGALLIISGIIEITYKENSIKE